MKASAVAARDNHWTGHFQVQIIADGRRNLPSRLTNDQVVSDRGPQPRHATFIQLTATKEALSLKMSKLDGTEMTNVTMEPG